MKGNGKMCHPPYTKGESSKISSSSGSTCTSKRKRTFGRVGNCNIPPFCLGEGGAAESQRRAGWRVSDQVGVSERSAGPDPSRLVPL